MKVQTRSGRVQEMEGIVIEDPFVVGSHATICHHSDREAFEVIKRTPSRLTLRRLKATLLNHMNSNEPDKLVATVGGFVAHVSGTQRYDYAADPEGKVVVASKVQRIHEGRRKNEATGEYETFYQVMFKQDGNSVIPGAHEHYDYNF